MAGLSRTVGLAPALGLAALLGWLAVEGARAQTPATPNPTTQTPAATEPAAAQTPIVKTPAEPTPAEQAAVVNKVQPALVQIMSAAANGKVLGSGFLFTADGNIATSLHLILGLKAGAVRLANGTVFDRFSIVAYDDRRDLAILKIAASSLPAMELGKSSELQPDETIFIFDNSGGDAAAPAVTPGIVSTFREYEGFSVIQTDADANPHNSGTPLVNLKGQAVGILGFKVPPAGNLSFAVPINYLRALLAGGGVSLTVDAVREALAKGSGTSSATTSTVPRFWKSSSTPIRYWVRLDGDHMTAEQILPDVQHAGNPSSRYDAQKSAQLYVGKIYYSGACGPVSCPFEDQAEFTRVTADRIEGAALSYPAVAQQDCQACKISKPKQIVKFSWIPE
jgi:hypothetical protein